MARLFNFDDMALDEVPTPTGEVLRVANILSALAAEHDRALRATAKAALPRRSLAELRELYCVENSDSGPAEHGKDDCATSSSTDARLFQER